MAVPRLEAILNPDGVGLAAYRILTGLPEPEKRMVATALNRTIETAVHEAIDPPPPRDEHQEFWWIFSPAQEPWAGVRMAVFTRATNGPEIMFIQAETDQRRIGPRIWEDVAPREQWRKVMRIPVPKREDIEHAA